MILEHIAGAIGLRRQDDAANGVLYSRVAIGSVVHRAAQAARGFIAVIMGGRLGFDDGVTGRAGRRQNREGKATTGNRHRRGVDRIAIDIGAGKRDGNARHALTAIDHGVIVVIGIDCTRQARGADLHDGSLAVIGRNGIFTQRIAKSVQSGRDGGRIGQIGGSQRPAVGSLSLGIDGQIDGVGRTHREAAIDVAGDRRGARAGNPRNRGRTAARNGAAWRGRRRIDETSRQRIGDPHASSGRRTVVAEADGEFHRFVDVAQQRARASLADHFKVGRRTDRGGLRRTVVGRGQIGTGTVPHRLFG